MIAIGIGCRKNCPAKEIIALVHAALKQCNLNISDVDIIATASMKSQEAGIVRVAHTLGLTLILISRAQMEEVADRALTHSANVLAMHGVPSIAETAALAAAGKKSKLLQGRIVSASAACAIAKGTKK